MILKVFLWFACNSDVLKSHFYCRKTAIFKVLHTLSKQWVLSLFYRFVAQFWSHFCHIFAYFLATSFFIDFQRFFGPKPMPKIDPKWPQNRRKINPRSNPNAKLRFCRKCCFSYEKQHILMIGGCKNQPKTIKNQCKIEARKSDAEMLPIWLKMGSKSNPNRSQNRWKNDAKI